MASGRGGEHRQWYQILLLFIVPFHSTSPPIETVTTGVLVVGNSLHPESDWLLQSDLQHLQIPTCFFISSTFFNALKGEKVTFT